MCSAYNVHTFLDRLSYSLDASMSGEKPPPPPTKHLTGLEPAGWIFLHK